MRNDQSKHIIIEEQGLRDGFQSEKTVVPTERKLEIIDALADAGVSRIQICSFVHPQYVPQMADAEAVCKALRRRPGVIYSGLVLNLKGVERAVDAGLDHVAASISASDTHSRKNTGKSLEEVQAGYAEMVRTAKDAGLTVRGGLQCVFGCRFEGAIDPNAVLDLVKRHLDLEIDELALADSTGMADPNSMTDLMGQHMAYGALTDEPVPPMPARVSAWSIYRVFECQDGPLFIGIISEKHWKAFCTAFGRDDWLADERLGTNNDRISEREWLHPAVAEMIAGYPRAEVTARLDKAGVPFSPIARPEDLYDDPHLNDGLGLLETVLPAGVTAKLPRIPLEMGDHDFGLRRNPPQIGEDTTDLLKDLGYDEDQIANLVKDGVVAVED